MESQLRVFKGSEVILGTGEFWVARGGGWIRRRCQVEEDKPLKLMVLLSEGLCVCERSLYLMKFLCFRLASLCTLKGVIFESPQIVR